MSAAVPNLKPEEVKGAKTEADEDGTTVLRN
jgi:hypothetical protein